MRCGYEGKRRKACLSLRLTLLYRRAPSGGIGTKKRSHRVLTPTTVVARSVCMTVPPVPGDVLSISQGKYVICLSIATMTIHNLYIFSRTGTLLYYTEWNRLNKSGITKEEEAKLMYGMLFSIKSFVSKISPLDPKDGFSYYKTSKYTLHYFETPSGLKFVLNTDNSAQNVRELLQQLYSEVYLAYVVKNPLCQLNEPIQSEIFKLKVDELIKKSPIFLNRPL